jgi:hypothetical protein
VDVARVSAATPSRPLARQLAAAARQLLRARRVLSDGCGRARARFSSLPRQQRLLLWPVLGSLGLLVGVAGMASPATRLPAPKESVEPPALSANVGARATGPEALDSARSVADASVRPHASAARKELAAALPTGVDAPYSSLERAAFRAAFGGNMSHAVALYQELAQRSGKPVFAEAARLLQSGRLQKP